LPFNELLEKEDIPLAYGGLVFNLIPALRERIPGHYLGETLAEAPEAVEGLISKRPQQMSVDSLTEDYQRARQAFTQKYAALIAQLATELEQEGIHPQHLIDANLPLTDNVIAALQLGDLHFLAQNMEWIKGLIRNYGIPVESLDQYVDSYQAAVREVIGEDGNVVIEYFEGLDSVAA
jgi:hypothetical protein